MLINQRIEKPCVSIVIPAFNEALRIKNAREQFQLAIQLGALDDQTTELIFVDDGSDDDTSRRLRDEMSCLFRKTRFLRSEQNQGKGAAIRKGVAVATAPYVVFMDIDMAVSPSQVPQLIAQLGTADIAVGSRSHSQSVIQTDRIFRVMMGKTYSYFANTITPVNLKDTQCGFKAFRTPIAKVLFHFMSVDRFGFDVDLLLLARRWSLRVEEVPVDWRDMPGSTVRTLVDPWVMIADLMRLRMRTRHKSIRGIKLHGTAVMNGTYESVTAHLQSISEPIVPMLGTDNEALFLFPLSSELEVKMIKEAVGSLNTDLKIEVVELSMDELAPLLRTS